MYNISIYNCIIIYMKERANIKYITYTKYSK